MLADPGEGKSIALHTEAEAVGGRVLEAAAIRAGLEDNVTADTILFIDAVDEATGTTTSTEDVVEAIARFILKSGKPYFRIACRSADWQSARFRKLLERVAGDDDLQELDLERLDDDEIRALTPNWLDPQLSVEAFLDQARHHGVYELLRNPLLLELMISAVAEKGIWPTTRKAIYEAACRQLAEEKNEAHFQKEPAQPGAMDKCLEDAGTLSALLLLSALHAINRTASTRPLTLTLSSLPSELQFQDSHKALHSKLFSSDANAFYPRHRTIAEFLAARALAQRVRNGLPLSRILSQVCGQDGIPVEALRGLCAWLAVHLSGPERHQLLVLDPLGFLVNGDTQQLNHEDRLCVLQALAHCAKDDPWFRRDQWEGQPFGGLATPDMADEFKRQLEYTDRSDSHQAYIACVLDALIHAATPISLLSGVLVGWVDDNQVINHLRDAAYDAWRRHCPPDRKDEQLKTWLAALAAGNINDPDDQLLGRILRDAYPHAIQQEVLNYMKPLRRRNFIGVFVDFWHRRIAKQTPSSLLPIVATAWLQKFPGKLPDDTRGDYGPIAKNLLAALLHAHGDQASVEDLESWLTIGMHCIGTSFAAEKSQKSIVAWIEAHPDKVKAAIALQYQILQPDQHGRKRYWEAELRLQGAKRPSDWLRWQMGLAASSENADFVAYVIGQVAPAVWDPPVGLEIPSADEVYHWVKSLSAQHHLAEQWLTSSWFLPLDDWRGDQYRRNIRAQAERNETLLKRNQDWTPILDALPETPLEPHDLYLVALAIEGHHPEIDGDSAESRVENLLGSDSAQAHKAIAAVDGSLVRNDLPDVHEVLDLFVQGQEHCIRKPALVAAKRACEANLAVWQTWSDELLRVLIAFWVMYEFDNEPTWLKSLGEERPVLVADVFQQIAKTHFQHNTKRPFPGLFQIVRDEKRRELAKAILPIILNQFPHISSESSRIELNGAMLFGLPLLPDDQAVGIVASKLSLETLDTDQRIAWQLALLPYQPATIGELATFVGSEPSHIEALGKAIDEQHLLDRAPHALPMHCVKSLIQTLIQTTRDDGSWQGGFVTAEKRRMDTIKSLLHRVGSSGTPEAGSVLQDLLASGQLDSWKTTVEFELRRHIERARETSYIPSGASSIAQLLCNAHPANLPDFVALLVDYLREIQGQLRGNPEFQLKAFYSDNDVPRIENDCRDILLEKLRSRCNSLEIDVQPESAAPALKRMDLRATTWTQSNSGRKMSLPIEAKKDKHPDVWMAWQSQLQCLYTIDPAAGGYGIYLVLWFGVQSTPSPDGYSPTSAKDLESKLKEKIPAADRAKLQVVVLDFSWPDYIKEPKPKLVKTKTKQK